MFECGKERNNIKSRCVSVMGVKLRNLLKDDLKLCTSLSSFKRSLKQKIVNEYSVSM